ncbi:outer membrane lipoprotein LolB [Lampropedia hyalina DSM 16112]|uniref:Outer-membrane lipoprotein LolB n=1 Tax=Lampropedia hyalina DSM 16112 TaxID=1122156 RepID=A0A1M4TGW9_9BURK|nr:lipoprotein insertase outer membrane protein LolB [Lampropedia hyalina]SHE43701.1 outer membrane lipoprotein LolB [Lampropedia hyalina DSM 16112]
MAPRCADPLPTTTASMLPRRQWLLRWGSVAAALALSACSLAPRQPYRGRPGHWRGRISIQLEEADRPQSYIASFLLQGHIGHGTLNVYSPIGTTIAQLRWDGRRAELDDGTQITRDRSLDQLLAQVFGTPLPTEALFAWLAGEAAQASGWQVNLERYAQGRIDAIRHSPLPTTRMRIVLHSEE